MSNESLDIDSDLDIPGINEFREHFKNHYEKDIEKDIKYYNVLKYFNPMYPGIILFFITILISFSSQYYFDNYKYVVIGFTIILFLFMILDLYRDRMRRKLINKNVLTYYLVKASESYDGYFTEKKSAKNEDYIRFLTTTLTFVNYFDTLLRTMLSRVGISLNLPIINELIKLSDNISDRIYPMVEEGNRIKNLFLTLARFFFYEREYDQLPNINTLIENNLEKKPKQKEIIKKINLSSVVRSNYMLSVICLFFIDVIIVLFGVFLIRYNMYGFTNYWTYIAENAVRLLQVIAAIYIPLFLALRSSVVKEEHV